MDIKALIKHWEITTQDHGPTENFSINLSLKEAAQIHALTELFPGRTPEQILQELINCALVEMKEQFPYIQGKQIGVDENGDPIHEDIGLTPQFVDATRRHLTSLKNGTHN